jgi:hypothetical protein
MQTGIYRKKYDNGSVNSEEHLKKKPGRHLFRPMSIHLCHQTPNPARQTVPLKSLPYFEQVKWTEIQIESGNIGPVFRSRIFSGP